MDTIVGFGGEQAVYAGSAERTRVESGGVLAVDGGPAKGAKVMSGGEVRLDGPASDVIVHAGGGELLAAGMVGAVPPAMTAQPGNLFVYGNDPARPAETIGDILPHTK